MVLLLLVAGLCGLTAVVEILGIGWANLNNVLAFIFLAGGALLLLTGWRQERE